MKDWLIEGDLTERIREIRKAEGRDYGSKPSEGAVDPAEDPAEICRHIGHATLVWGVCTRCGQVPDA